MPRRPALAPANDCIAYLKGVRDSTDLVDADGNPKFINNGTGTWTLYNPNGYTDREDILASGTVVATGSLSAVGTGGDYLLQFPNSLSILSTVDYYLRVVLTSGSFQLDILDIVSSIVRTGRTNIT